MSTVKAVENGLAENTKTYEWKSGSVTVTGTTPNADLAAQSGFTALFSQVKRAHRISISATSTIYVILTADGDVSTGNDIITITSTTPYTSNYCVVEKIWVATNNAGVTITVSLS